MYSPTVLLAANLYLDNTKIATCNGDPSTDKISLTMTKKASLLESEINLSANKYYENYKKIITNKENVDSSPLVQIVKELITLNEMEEYLKKQRKKYISSVLVLYSFVDKKDEVYYYGTWSPEIEKIETMKVGAISHKVFKESTDFIIQY